MPGIRSKIVVIQPRGELSYPHQNLTLNMLTPKYGVRCTLEIMTNIIHQGEFNKTAWPELHSCV